MKQLLTFLFLLLVSQKLFSQDTIPLNQTLQYKDVDDRRSSVTSTLLLGVGGIMAITGASLEPYSKNPIIKKSYQAMAITGVCMVSVSIPLDYFIFKLK